MSVTAAIPKRRNGPGKPWVKGQSGNPKGRPKGTRHKATVALDALGPDVAHTAFQQVMQKVRAGDVEACKVILDRCWPKMRHRPVRLDLPPIDSAEELPRAMQQVVAAMATGSITSVEASNVASVLEHIRRAYEASSFDQRLVALEAALGKTRTLDGYPLSEQDHDDDADAA